VERKRELKPMTVEGYVWVVGFGMDDVFVHPDRPNPESEDYLDEAMKRRWEARKVGVNLLDLLERLEGRRVRVTVEEGRITIEALD